MMCVCVCRNDLCFLYAVPCVLYAVPCRVLSLLPKVKLIVILQDPVKRAYSWYQVGVATFQSAWLYGAGKGVALQLKC